MDGWSAPVNVLPRSARTHVLGYSTFRETIRPVSWEIGQGAADIVGYSVRRGVGSAFRKRASPRDPKKDGRTMEVRAGTFSACHDTCQRPKLIACDC
jgi:hypothetical protein